MTGLIQRPRRALVPGTRFGLLVVEGPAPDRRRSRGRKRGTRAAWWCRCDCGERIAVNQDSLEAGVTRSCGCLRVQAVRRLRRCALVPIGERFGALVVEGAASPEANGGARWSCRCDCGRVIVVRAVNVRRRADRPCGCTWRTPDPSPAVDSGSARVRPCHSPDCSAEVDASSGAPRYCPACRMARRQAASRRRLIASLPSPEPVAPAPPPDPSALPPCPACGGRRCRDGQVVYCAANRCEAGLDVAPQREKGNRAPADPSPAQGMVTP